MASLRRALGLTVATLALALTIGLGNPAPEAASANAPCDAASGPIGAVTGAVGIGNPVGDACNTVTDPVLGVAGKALDPLKDAASSIGQGIFKQITEWVADGATWLVGQVVAATDATTSPNLLSKGFVRSYRQMALIAAAMGALMLVFAVIDSLGRGDSEGLVRVFLVNVPLAAIATSAAYVVVQLLIGATDGFSHAIAASSAKDTHDFFASATETLSEAGAVTGAAAGTPAGAGGTAAGAGGGAVALPLFVGFIAAVVAAFAALAVWIELLMRSAAIYAVALFMPLALAASIWPRWSATLRRTCELVIVVVFSKFVIVSIVALSTSLLANTGGRVEHVLSAAALLLLACFAPFVLYRLVPFAEGAISNLYNRQSAAGAGVRTVEFASSVQMMRRAALANWALNSTQGGGGDGGGGQSGSGGQSAGGKPGGAGGGGAAEGGEAAGAGAGAAGAVAAPVAAGAAAAKGSKAAAARLAESGTAQAAQGGTSTASPESAEGAQGGAGAQAASRPSQDAERPSSAAASRGGAEPKAAEGGEAPAAQSKPPRPAGEVGTAGGGNAASGSGGGAGTGGGGAA